MDYGLSTIPTLKVQKRTAGTSHIHVKAGGTFDDYIRDIPLHTSFIPSPPLDLGVSKYLQENQNRLTPTQTQVRSMPIAVL
jgi:hypothetical protein